MFTRLILTTICSLFFISSASAEGILDDAINAEKEMLRRDITGARSLDIEDNRRKALQEKERTHRKNVREKHKQQRKAHKELRRHHRTATKNSRHEHRATIKANHKEHRKIIHKEKRYKHREFIVKKPRHRGDREGNFSLIE